MHFLQKGKTPIKSQIPLAAPTTAAPTQAAPAEAVPTTTASFSYNTFNPLTAKLGLH